MKKENIVIDASDRVTEEEVTEAARVLAGGVQPVPLPEGEGGEQSQWQPYIWNGMDGLRCTWCEWDTLDGIGAAQEHMRRCPRCAPSVELPSQSSQILIADRYGNVINDQSLAEPIA